MKKPIKWPDIILLNGISSAGKSTLAKALQDAISHPYLLFGFDSLVFMMPERYWKSAATAEQADKSYSQEGVEMVEAQQPDEPKKVVAVFGPVFRTMISSMAPVVATLVKQGTSVIFDHVLHDQQMYEECVRCFSAFNVLKVGVFCPLEIAEQRERERQDRVIGRARGLIDVVHSFCDYDVSIHTDKMSVAESVQLIINKITGVS